MRLNEFFLKECWRLIDGWREAKDKLRMCNFEVLSKMLDTAGSRCHASDLITLIPQDLESCSCPYSSGGANEGCKEFKRARSRGGGTERWKPLRSGGIERLECLGIFSVFSMLFFRKTSNLKLLVSLFAHNLYAAHWIWRHRSHKFVVNF